LCIIEYANNERTYTHPGHILTCPRSLPAKTIPHCIQLLPLHWIATQRTASQLSLIIPFLRLHLPFRFSVLHRLAPYFAPCPFPDPALPLLPPPSTHPVCRLEFSQFLTSIYPFPPFQAIPHLDCHLHHPSPLQALPFQFISPLLRQTNPPIG
jgi:hypothetical protein